MDWEIISAEERRITVLFADSIQLVINFMR